MRDPYEVLGVSRTADEDAIRAAYRKLAKKHHPDLNPGDKKAEEAFKEISQASTILSDAEKRAKYDRGEIDASGAEKPTAQSFYRGGGRGGMGADVDMDGLDIDDILAQAFGHGGAGRSRSRQSRRGRDEHYTLAVEFVEAATGGKQRLVLPDGRELDVTIPEGIADGQTLRLKGKGGPGAVAGDALIEIQVKPHRFFRREGNDIVMDLPVTLKEAVLGGKVPVPTIKGTVNLAIPPCSNTGSRLRLKDRGVKGGHQYVVLQVMVPPEPDAALKTFLEGWTPERPYDPRARLAL